MPARIVHGSDQFGSGNSGVAHYLCTLQYRLLQGKYDAIGLHWCSKNVSKCSDLQPNVHCWGWKFLYNVNKSHLSFALFEDEMMLYSWSLKYYFNHLHAAFFFECTWQISGHSLSNNLDSLMFKSMRFHKVFTSQNCTSTPIGCWAEIDDKFKSVTDPEYRHLCSYQHWSIPK